MKQENRNTSLNETKYVDFPTTEKEIIRAIFCLTHDATVEEPNEAMKSSQAALNLGNTLATLHNVYHDPSFKRNLKESVNE